MLNTKPRGSNECLATLILTLDAKWKWTVPFRPRTPSHRTVRYAQFYCKNAKHQSLNVCTVHAQVVFRLFFVRSELLQAVYLADPYSLLVFVFCAIFVPRFQRCP